MRSREPPAAFVQLAETQLNVPGADATDVDDVDVDDDDDEGGTWRSFRGSPAVAGRRAPAGLVVGSGGGVAASPSAQRPVSSPAQFPEGAARWPGGAETDRRPRVPQPWSPPVDRTLGKEFPVVATVRGRAPDAASPASQASVQPADPSGRAWYDRRTV